MPTPLVQRGADRVKREVARRLAWVTGA